MKTTPWLAALLLSFISAGAANADSTYRVLHTFKGSDGTYPGGSLLIVGDMAYGTTLCGGSSNSGVLYQLDLRTNSYRILHTFQQERSSNGGIPYGNSVVLSGNTLYGMTEMGGHGNAGTIYRYDLGTKEFGIVHSFAADASEGAWPVLSSLTPSGTGFYGVLQGGGLRGGSRGAIFKFDAAAATPFTVMHRFAGAEGANPMGQLRAYGNALFGTTQDGGATDGGTIYSIDATTGALTTLHHFTGGASDGQHPWGNSLTLVGSKFYGMTQAGGGANKGTLYCIDPATGAFSLLHAFTGRADDGGLPFGASLLAAGGKLFGMTDAGGTANAGTVFEYDLGTGEFDLLHSFTGGNECCPRGDLALSGSTLYGTTYGEPNVNYGTVFAIDVALPEPASLAVLGVGAAGLLLRRRR